MKNENKTKSKQIQTVINVEKTDKDSFNTIKGLHNLSDKELFSVLLTSQEEISEEAFQKIVDKVVLKKQIAKVQAKISKMELKLSEAKAEAAVVIPEEEFETLIG